MSQSNSKRRSRSRKPQHMPPLSIITRVSSSDAPVLCQQSHRNNNDIMGGPPYNIANKSSAATSSLLVSLSESCRKHSASAHESNKGLCAATVVEAPQCCQEALASLRTILPKVEKAYPPHKTLVQDLAHMCDFYNDVLSGGFCPNAPHLFLGVNEILPRVYYLFQHLASQAVIHNSVQRVAASDAAPTVLQISRTAARLLNAVPNSNLQDCILRDLVYLSKDLSVLSEAGVLDESDNIAVEAVLFEETVENSNWTATPNRPDFVLRLASSESLLSVLGATLLTLENFVRIRKERRLLLLHQHTDALGTVLEEMDDCYFTAGNPDLFYGSLQTHEEGYRALLISLRQVLLSGTKASTEKLSLLTISNQTACQILLQIYADWNRTNAPSMSLLQEISILVAESSLAFLRASSLTDQTLSTDLARLVHGFVLVPPRVQTSVSTLDIAVKVQSITAPAIFESVCYMQRNIAHGDAEAATADATEARKARLLELVLLRVLLATMISMQSLRGGKILRTAYPLSVQLFVTDSITRGLLDCLRDPILADSAALILSHLIFPVGAASSYLTEINDVARACREMTLQEFRNESSESLEGPLAATKRKADRACDPWTRPKRRRICGQRSEPSMFSSVHGLLSSLLQQVVQSIGSINDTINNSKITEYTVDETVFACSTVKLIFASLVNCPSLQCHRSEEYPELLQLFDRILEAISLLGTLLFSTTTAETRHMKLIVDAMVSCGLFLDILRTDDVKIRTRTRHDFILKMKSLREAMHHRDCCIGWYPGIPQESLIGRATNNDVCYWTGLDICSEGFGDSFMVGIGNVDNVAGSVFPIPPGLRANDFRIADTFQIIGARLSEDWNFLDNRLNDSLDRVATFIDRSHDDPVVRLLVWQSVAWILRNTPQQDLRNLLNADSSLGLRLVHFLFDTALRDPDPAVQDYASREIGHALQPGEWFPLKAAIASLDEWELLGRDQGASSSAVRQTAEHVKKRLFERVDSALNKLCSVPQSHISLGVASEQQLSPKQESPVAIAILNFRRSAARVLCSLCISPPPHTYFGRLSLEHAVVRAVRLWSGIDTTPRFEYMGVGFAEFSRLCVAYGSELAIQFAPAVFRDVLVPCSSFVAAELQDSGETLPIRFQERQFGLLSSFLRVSLVQSWSQMTVSAPLDDTDLERTVESCLPYVLSQLVVEKDKVALHLTSAYKLYLLSVKRLEHKSLKRSGTSYLDAEQTGGLVVEAVVSLASKSSSKQWSRNLEEQTRQLCLAPGLIEQIIPLVFMRAGRSELLFFTKDVLQDKLSLQQLISSREMLTLKNFVLKLGRNPEMTDLVIRGLETAAVARNGSNPERTAVAETEQGGDSALSIWLTTHFMYLLVNVVQFRWATKTAELRVQSLRSLANIIDFLRPSEAPQYLPQIMASVNAALAHSSFDVAFEEITARTQHQLRLLAVQVLSKYVKRIAETQRETIGQNLTSIVVSLIPVLSDEHCNHSHPGSTVDEIRSTAVALLEFLTQGELGQYLSGFFNEIPFLPPSSALDSVRSSLRSLGVDFDTLQVASTQVTQLDTASRDDINDTSSISVDSRGTAHIASRQNALRKRLETVCSLLGNENTSVRRVVLQYITSLLRANREVFHALVENESTASMKCYLTVAYIRRKGLSRGAITEVVESLLQRCVHETDPEARVLLATCFGEIGAVGAHRLEEVQPTYTVDSFQKSCDPPWLTSPHEYELTLISKHLVVALKSAQTSSDQHKIAFTIQQLLALLNEAAKKGLISDSTGEKVLSSRQRSSGGLKVDNDDTRSTGLVAKPQMEQTLLAKLGDAMVLDIVEPFWFSEFHEAENNPPRQPPFFRGSSSFYGWLSNWCRYMVYRSYSTTESNEWTKVFFACRTALRTQAGLNVAESLLPLLVLHRLCFGGVADQNSLLSEINDVLIICAENNSSPSNHGLSRSDRRKAVGAIFALMDLLEHWVEPESERRYTLKKGRHNDGEPRTACTHDWQQSDAAMRIDDMVGKITYSLRAKAAASVGMHGCALRYLEMASRAAIADQVFGRAGADLHRDPNWSRAAGFCPKEDVGLMKDALASLNDYETMFVMGDESIWSSPIERVRDSIRQKEALCDWQGAIHDYERAEQLNFGDASIRLGSLQCLLQLGHFESVLLQVDGIIHDHNHDTKAPASAATVPLAIEASWRLGKWDKLSDLLETERSTIKNPDGLYQVHLGEAMLGIHRKEFDRVFQSVKSARVAVMEGLSSVARESYARAYDHIVRLQSLREVEDAADLLRSEETLAIGELVDDPSFGWNRRLDFVSSTGTTAVINVRLALARLSADSAFEGSLFLRIGKSGRKNGMLSMASNCFAQAEAALNSIDNDRKAALKSDLQMQLAKLRHQCGDSSVALRMLGQENIETMNVLDDGGLLNSCCRQVVDLLGVKNHGMNESKIIDVFVRSALQSTRWMIESGLKGGAEITSRFCIIHRVSPKFEKGHFHYAKYVDSLLHARIEALRANAVASIPGADDETHRTFALASDETCQRYLSLAINHYSISLQLQVKHVYQSLPRLLSLWFDFTAIRHSSKSSVSNSTMSGKSDFPFPLAEKMCSFLKDNQEQLNVFVSRSFKAFPAHALYTAMPQLISRITHDNSLTAEIAQGMLKRILVKHPAQAMWPLAWVRQSRDPARKSIGTEIFNKAVQSSIKHRHKGMEKLLISSKTLLEYLHDIAIAETSRNSDKFLLKPIGGSVDLTDFVPPVQAALSVSLASGDSGRARDTFPRHVPRIRAFDLTVQVMVSKARPKKLRAFLVSADANARVMARSDRNPKPIDVDIGELHFLVKQEANGDLRKDARVQDLNNVVNRIMASSNDFKGLSSQRRRLHLRTFTVTCLSEETGILEWVPHTGSMRSFITKAYNPQAKQSDGKRLGKRLVRFNDPQVKLKFEKTCQNKYFEDGNLTEAAAVFEKEFLKPFPPLLYWWFVAQYPDPHAWYEARTRFTMSAAVWSAVGHVIGLGDRHSDNILLDKATGECVHVDFDCIFDKGLHLPKPEVVPFRLTQNMVDAFGPTGADGVYSCNLKVAMSILRDNRDILLSVLEPFVRDPIINWKKHRGQQKKAPEKGSSIEAKQKIRIIEERLQGIYNLQNPNQKKIKRSDRSDNQEDNDLSILIPLSVEGQVHKMVAEARSSENLCQLFIGWMPWV